MRKALSRHFFSSVRNFKFVGSPARPRGPSNELSATYVTTSGFNNEPIRVHCISCYVSMVYLIEYVARKKFLLFDTGFATDFYRIEYYMNHVLNRDRDVKVSLEKDLSLVCVSHSHLDHCGSSQFYVDRGIPFVRPTNMESCYVGVSRRWNMLAEMIALENVRCAYKRTREDSFLCSQGLFGPYWNFEPPAVKLLDDGDAFPNGFEDWVAIKMPGHTTHMTGFYHLPSGLFYSADLTVRLRNGFFPSMPMNYLWAYKQTVERLRALDVRCALLAHGGPIDVAAECGSWNSILDNLYTNLIQEYQPSTDKKSKGGKPNPLKFLLNLRKAEARHFTPDDLNHGPLPVLSKTPAPFKIITEAGV